MLRCDPTLAPIALLGTILLRLFELNVALKLPLVLDPGKEGVGVGPV